MAFDAADVKADLEYHPSETGQRRTLVEQYYHTLDWTSTTDVRKFLLVAHSVMAELEAMAHQAPINGEYANSERSRIQAAFANDGFEYVDGRFTPKGSASHLAEITASAAKLDAPELHRQLERMRASMESDPALILGTAKELIETACKTILEDRERPVNADWDIGRLVKETREALKLLPSDIPDEAKGAEAMKRLLGSLGAVAQGLAELRNLYGTGHGRSGKRRGIEPRHARLASGAAAALVTFLLETHWERQE